MEKQTAVEWLIEKYIEKSVICLDDIQQAKEMEKKQFLDLHIKTMKEGLIHEGSKRWNKDYLPQVKSMAEKTWNKTFSNETND